MRHKNYHHHKNSSVWYQDNGSVSRHEEASVPHCQEERKCDFHNLLPTLSFAVEIPTKFVPNFPVISKIQVAIISGSFLILFYFLLHILQYLS